MNWLKNYIDYKGLSVLRFEKSVGTRSTIDKAIKNNTNLRSDMLAKIIEVYKDINPSWLISGKGEMLLSSENTGFKNSFSAGNTLDITSLLTYLLENNQTLIQDESFRDYIKMNMVELETEETKIANQQKREALKKVVRERLLNKDFKK